MAVGRCDTNESVVNGGSATLNGSSSNFYAGKAQTVGDPAGLLSNQVINGRFLAGEWRGEVLPASANDVHEPLANVAAVVTYAAEDYRRHVIFGLAWSYSAAPTGGGIKVEDGAGTEIFSQSVVAAGPGFCEFPKGLKGDVNTAMIVTLAAGGGTVVGKVCVTGRRVE